MANDIDPCKGTLVLENKKFAESKFNKIIVRTEDECATDLLSKILVELGGSGGMPIYITASDVTTPETEQTLISETVGVGKMVSLKSVRVSCRRCLTYGIYVDSTLVGSGRLGASNLNDDYLFNVDFEVTEGQLIEVKVLALPGPASDVEVYVQALDL